MSLIDYVKELAHEQGHHCGDPDCDEDHGEVRGTETPEGELG